MEWTSRERLIVRELANAVEVNLDAHAIPWRPTGISPRTAPEEFWDALSASLDNVSGVRSRPSTADLVTFLESVAHKNQIDTSDRFWRVKAIAVVLLQHPDLDDGQSIAGKDDSKGYRARREADLNEEWIRANQLRSLLMAKLGRKVSMQEWAEEMAVRNLGLDADQASWSQQQADRYISSTGHYLRRLKELRRDYESLLATYNFKRPSMRRNSKYWTHTQAGTSAFRWAPSDSELMEQPEWKRHMRELREEHLLEARRQHKH